MGEEQKTQEAVAAAQAAHAQMVVGDDKERQNVCMKEIQEVLSKYDCVLIPRAMLHPGGREFMIETQTKPRPLKEGPPDPPEPHDAVKGE